VREFGGAVGRIDQPFDCGGAILEGVHVRSRGEMGSPFAVGLEASSARGQEPDLAAMEPGESPIKLRDARDQRLQRLRPPGTRRLENGAATAVVRVAARKVCPPPTWSSHKNSRRCLEAGKRTDSSRRSRSQ
jgi:hypothetical protein